MTDTPPAEDQGDSGVLRPFVDHPHDPLPSVEPPRLSPPPPDDPPVPAAPGWTGVPAPPTDPLSAGRSVSAPDRKPRTVVVSRRMIGLMAVVTVAVIAGLVFLWQSSSTDSSAAPAGSGIGPAVVSTTLGQGSGTEGTTTVTTTEAPTTTAATTVEDLRARVRSLEGLLAAVPAPALPGTSLQRIVVSAEASFVSASDTSVAVVGPFGNFANIDPATNAVVAAGKVADGATRVIRTPQYVWLTDYQGGQLVWVDPVSNSVKGVFAIPGPDGLAKDGGSLIVASFDAQMVERFDPAVGKVVEQVSVGGNPTAVAVGKQGGIWATIFDTGELVRIDPANFTISDRIPVGAGPVGIALSPGTVWVANHDEGTIAEVSIAERKVIATINVGDGPTELLVDSGSLWVTVTGAGDLVQIDLATGKIVTRTPLGGVARGGGPTGISAGAGSIWVAVEGEQSVVRVTPPT